MGVLLGKHLSNALQVAHSFLTIPARAGARYGAEIALDKEGNLRLGQNVDEFVRESHELPVVEIKPDSRSNRLARIFYEEAHRSWSML